MIPDGLRVLIVEDDMIVAFLIEDYFSELGCRIVALEMRLEPALEAARAAEIDFALLDINLNGELSFPVATVLRDRGIAFAFATGYNESLIPAEFSGIRVVSKPFDARDLAAVLALTWGEAALPPSGSP